MVARIQTYHFQSYKLHLPTDITRDFPLDGLQEVEVSMFHGLSVQKVNNKIPHIKKIKYIKSFNSYLVSVI